MNCEPPVGKESPVSAHLAVKLKAVRIPTQALSLQDRRGLAAFHKAGR